MWRFFWYIFVIDFSLYFIVVREHILYDFSSFKFVEVCFMIWNIACHSICFVGTWKECIVCCFNGIFYKYQLDQVMGVTTSKLYMSGLKLTRILSSYFFQFIFILRCTYSELTVSLGCLLSFFTPVEPELQCLSFQLTSESLH